MAITTLGKYLRRLRLEKNEILKDVADVLGVSSAYLSAIEHGKKKLSDQSMKIIINHYKLDNGSKQQLIDARELSQNEISINLKGSKEGDRKLALAFARKLDSLDEAEKEHIFALLNGD